MEMKRTWESHELWKNPALIGIYLPTLDNHNCRVLHSRIAVTGYLVCITKKKLPVI